MKPNGPVAAVMLAAGFGALVLGVLTTLGEASKGFGEWLQFGDRVGPLSGKVTISVAVFIFVWLVLGLGSLRDREVEWAPAVYATIGLVFLGILGTFPTFFQIFG
jgi:hypothetical protein